MIPFCSIAALAITSLIAGCSSNGHAARAESAAPRFTPWTGTSLVLAAVNQEHDRDANLQFEWEYARRDADLGEAGSPNEAVISVAEIRHREYLRTNNGRPHDDSYTTSRSYERRMGP